MEQVRLHGAGPDPTWQIALACEDQVIIANKWQTAPGLQGMSRGAIVRLAGLQTDLHTTPSEVVTAKLNAITIERRRGERGRGAALIGTRIKLHFGLIHKFCQGF